jgi:hypothetical protein
MRSGFKADLTGNVCEHQGGEYVAGGGFATTYNARLTTPEKPMGKWMMQFFTGLEQHAADTPDVKFQMFHDMLDLLRRALGGLHVLRRKNWFAMPKTMPDVRVGFARMLHKCLPHSQYATSDDKYLPVYRAACQQTFQSTGLRAKLTFEIVWAAVSEQAQIPYEALPYHCLNDKRFVNARKKRQAQGKKRQAQGTSSSLAMSVASAKSHFSPAIQLSPERLAAIQETQKRVARELAQQNTVKRMRAQPPTTSVLAPLPSRLFGLQNAAVTVPSWLCSTSAPAPTSTPTPLFGSRAPGTLRLVTKNLSTPSHIPAWVRQVPVAQAARQAAQQAARHAAQQAARQPCVSTGAPLTTVKGEETDE